MENKLLKNFGEDNLDIVLKATDVLWNTTDRLIKNGQEGDLETFTHSFDAFYGALVASQPAPKQGGNSHDLTTGFLPCVKSSYQSISKDSPQYSWAKNTFTSFTSGILDIGEELAAMTVAHAFAELHANSTYIKQPLPQQFFKEFGKEGHTLSDLIAVPSDKISSIQDNLKQAFRP